MSEEKKRVPWWAAVAAVVLVGLVTLETGRLVAKIVRGKTEVEEIQKPGAAPVGSATVTSATSTAPVRSASVAPARTGAVTERVDGE